MESLRVRPGQRPLRSCRGCHYRRRWLSYIMALARTTVVKTVSGGWSQVLAEPGMLFEAGQLRRPEARDDGEGVAALVTI